MRISGREKFLSSSKASDKYSHGKTQEACDTYTDGVFAVLGLINEARWDPEKLTWRPGVVYAVGRRLTTSPGNRVSRNVAVTPDCVVQASESLGFVAEAKLSLPMDVNRWDEDVIQMLKYDDDLVGWWTADERLPRHDIIALVPLRER